MILSPWSDELEVSFRLFRNSSRGLGVVWAPMPWIHFGSISALFFGAFLYRGPKIGVFPKTPSLSGLAFIFSGHSSSDQSCAFRKIGLDLFVIPSSGFVVTWMHCWLALLTTWISHWLEDCFPARKCPFIGTTLPVATPKLYLRATAADD